MKKLIKNTIFILLLLALCPISQAKVIALKKCKLSLKKHDLKQHKKTIYFLNGLISSSQVYLPLMERLKVRELSFNLVTVDMPPTGESELNGDYNWKNIQSCMSEFLTDKKNYILALHDLSSAMILPIFKNLQELPKGIILLNALIRPSEYHLIYPFTLLKDKITSKVTSQVFPQFLYNKEIKKLSFADPNLMDDKTVDQIFSETLGGNPDELSQVVQGYPSSPALDQVIKYSLANPNVKQLVIWGLADSIMSNQLQFLDETSRHPHRETFLLKKAKHFLMWEYAKEISSVISIWLKKNNM